MQPNKMNSRLAAALLLCAVVASPTYAATADEVLKGCKNFPDSKMPRTCEAYFIEAIRFVNSDDPLANPKGKLCVGEEVPIADIINLVVEWIEQKPSRRSFSLFDAMHQALAPKYRCK